MRHATSSSLIPRGGVAFSPISDPISPTGDAHGFELIELGCVPTTHLLGKIRYAYKEVLGKWFRANVGRGRLQANVSDQRMIGHRSEMSLIYLKRLAQYPVTTRAEKRRSILVFAATMKSLPPKKPNSWHTGSCGTSGIVRNAKRGLNPFRDFRRAQS